VAPGREEHRVVGGEDRPAGKEAREEEDDREQEKERRLRPAEAPAGPSSGEDDRAAEESEGE
jgi:hypothetical protein